MKTLMGEKWVELSLEEEEELRNFPTDPRQVVGCFKNPNSLKQEWEERDFYGAPMGCYKTSKYIN